MARFRRLWRRLSAKRIAAFVNAGARATGPLLQGRFGLVAMEETHWLAALRYLASIRVRDTLVEVAPVLAVAQFF